MTNELEKQFFQCFGIEPKEYKACNSFPCGNPRIECENCKDYKLYKTEYPQITDRILLELICILSEWRTYLHSSYTIKANNTLNLKQDVLRDFLELFKWYEFKKCEKGIKHQVRTLFEEG